MDNSRWNIRSLVLSLLGLLPKLYPARFRREFSSEMQDIVLSRVRDAEELGWIAWLSVVFQEIMALVPSILQEYWHELMFQKERALVPESYALKHRYREAIAYVRWADPPLWLATLANLLPLWLIALAFELGIPVFILAMAVIVVLLWLGWFTPELILYCLFPFSTMILFEEISAPYKLVFHLLCTIILTIGIVIYRLCLEKDSISLGWLTLVVVFIATWMLAAHANQNYWQMTPETPWWIIFFAP